MIYMFASVGLFHNLFNLYEFQEKQNIEYQLGPKLKSEDFHDDLIGSQCRNIEYQEGRRAKLDVFHGLRKGGAGRVLTWIRGEAALPQTPNQRKTWKPEALMADTQVKAAYGFACWYARRSYDCSYVSKGGLWFGVLVCQAVL